MAAHDVGESSFPPRKHGDEQRVEAGVAAPDFPPTKGDAHRVEAGEASVVGLGSGSSPSVIISTNF